VSARRASVPRCLRKVSEQSKQHCSPVSYSGCPTQGPSTYHHHEVHADLSACGARTDVCRGRQDSKPAEPCVDHFASPAAGSGTTAALNLAILAARSFVLLRGGRMTWNPGVGRHGPAATVCVCVTGLRGGGREQGTRVCVRWWGFPAPIVCICHSSAGPLRRARACRGAAAAAALCVCATLPAICGARRATASARNGWV